MRAKRANLPSIYSILCRFARCQRAHNNMYKSHRECINIIVGGRGHCRDGVLCAERIIPEPLQSRQFYFAYVGVHVCKLDVLYGLK